VTPFPKIDPLHDATVSILGLTFQMKHVVVIIASIVMLVVLYLFVMRTKMGKAIRAISEDKDVAALMGIDVDQAITVTFMVGAAMAGAAGVLFGVLFRQTIFSMGFIPGVKAFTAAVLGGIGSVPGAAIGGLFLGIFESVGPRLFLQGLGVPASYQLRDVIAFSMLVLVLIFRPQGIVGEPLAEKKA
jgi:branched-chain amino acid transport system permease protein